MSTVAERAAAERASQGLDEHVQDDALLDWIAALLDGGGERLAETA